MNLSKANTKAYIAAVLMATAFTTASCGSDDPIVPPVVEPKAAVNILATVGSIATKADAAYAPKDGKLFLHYTSVGNKQTATFVCANSQWATAAPLYWDDLAPVGTAYPFFALAPAMPAATPAAAADQSTPEAYATADQLVAYTSATDEVAALPLSFKHILAQVKVTITAAVEATDPAYLDPASATLSIGGIRTAYTLSYEGATAAIPAVATATGDATSIIPSANAGSFYALAPAQTFAAGALTLTFVIADKPYAWSNTEAITSVAGMNTAINLSVQKTGITPANNITLTDWGVDSNPVNDNIEITK